MSFFNNKYAKLRWDMYLLIVDILKFIDIEERHYINDIPCSIIHLNGDFKEKNIEKSIFLLSHLNVVYYNFEKKNEFGSLARTVLEQVGDRSIKKKINIQFDSETDFLRKRIMFYMDEMRLLTELSKPHSGKMTYYWYLNPLSNTKDCFDKNTKTHMFFMQSIIGEAIPMLKKKSYELIALHVNEEVGNFKNNFGIYS